MKEAAKRTQIFIVLILIVAAFAAYYFLSKPSEEAIGQQVATMLQDKLNTSSPLNTLHMKVRGVDVMHSEGNKYSGMAHVNLNGELHDVPVEIVADGDRIMMQVPPGGFMFVAPELMKAATQQP